MQPVKYFLLARAIRLFLQFGFLFAVISFCVNIAVDLFKAKPYLQSGGWTIGTSFKGHKLKAVVSLRIPDTVKYYEHGEEQIDDYPTDAVQDRQKFNKGNLVDQVTNEIKSMTSEENKITIANELWADGIFFIKVSTTNGLLNVFWACIEQVDVVCVMLFFLLLIKLVNRYMDGEIFMPRTFRLVSFLGWLLIFSEVLQIAVGMINMSLLQHPSLITTSLLTNKHYDHFDLTVDFTGAGSYSNIGIGIFIILLSQVLKEAILVKQENELTI